MKFCNITASDLSKEFGNNFDLKDTLTQLTKKKDVVQPASQDSSTQSPQTTKADTIEDTTNTTNQVDNQEQSADYTNVAISFAVGVVAGLFILHVAKKR